MILFGGVDATDKLLNETFNFRRSNVSTPVVTKPSQATLTARTGHSAVWVPQGAADCSTASGCVLLFGGRDEQSTMNAMHSLSTGE
jgi:hypothetical protein